MTARCAFNGVTLCDNALYDASSGADQGLAIYRSGMSAIFPSIARAPFGLLKYIPEKLEYLMASIEDEAGLNAYRIEVHALKGTAATVGALLLSKLARILEVAAANGEIKKIHCLQPILLEEIEKHLERVETLFPDDRKEIESTELLSSYLEMLYIGVSQGDYDTADFMMLCAARAQSLLRAL